MHEQVLIVGGSGYIGKHLTRLLQAQGHTVSWLTRKINPNANIQQYAWDHTKRYLDRHAFDHTTVLINLAGASVGAKRWTKTFKQEIYASRVEATRFLAHTLLRIPHKVHTYIQASATGYYGLSTTQPCNENSKAGTDFLAQTCLDWELAASSLSPGIRTCFIRTGVVLGDDAEAFKRISLPFKWGLGAAAGSGSQYFPWIHIEDICRVYLWCMMHKEVNGPLNAVAPQQLSNRAFSENLARALHRPLWLPPVPAFALKLILGEFAGSILYGPSVVGGKLKDASFTYHFPTLESWLSAPLL